MYYPGSNKTQWSVYSLPNIAHGRIRRIRVGELYSFFWIVQHTINILLIMWRKRICRDVLTTLSPSPKFRKKTWIFSLEVENFQYSYGALCYKFILRSQITFSSFILLVSFKSYFPIHSKSLLLLFDPRFINLNPYPLSHFQVISWSFGSHQKLSGQRYSAGVHCRNRIRVYNPV